MMPPIGEDGCPEVSVIIVNFNAGPLLAECVSAVLTSDVAVEVLVSDNGSRDESIGRLEACHGHDQRLRIFRNRANLGFARGNNQVLEQATAPYVAFLNPDCLVEATTLGRMHRFMEATPAAGIVGGIMRNPDGSEQVASRRVNPNPWIGLIRLAGLERLLPHWAGHLGLNQLGGALPDQPVAVEAISGALMFVRRQALEEVGPLDEGYFLHCEDLDWFVRFRQAGWRLYLIPNAEAVHHKGACSGDRMLSVAWHKHRGMTRFFRKFQYDRYWWPFSQLVLVGIWAHFVAYVMGALSRRAFRGLRPRPRSKESRKMG